MRNDFVVGIERIKSVVSYNPDDGVFTWIAKSGPSVITGTEAGSKSSAGYIVLNIDKAKIQAHRAAIAITFGVWPELQVDHINGNRSDNRIANLRCVTCAENRQNITVVNSLNTSGYPGISWDKKKSKWRATVTVSGKHKHIGYFDCAATAYLHYLDAKSKFHPAWAGKPQSLPAPILEKLTALTVDCPNDASAEDTVLRNPTWTARVVEKGVVVGYYYGERVKV